jgi:predicted extracellular nuclease
MKKIVWSMILILLPWLLTGQGKRGAEDFMIVFYNVENLFDIVDNPITLDEAFTPTGDKQWNQERYQKKLDDLAEVFSTINNKNLPSIIGLCEVENRRVLEDLISTRKMRKEEYGIVHEDSPDIRGIDVALLYRKNQFKLESYKTISVDLPGDSVTTRDILYAKGNAGSEDLHLFVNHWSSRRDGQMETERRRIYAAVTLRKSVDSIISFEPEAKIIIMGDFNDEPTNLSLTRYLNAGNKRKNASSRELYNLMYDQHNLQDAGTYSFKGKWNMLDHLIVSQALLKDKKKLHLDFTDGKIYQDDWMLYENPKTGDKTPNKTYGGPSYFGGVSDHLPIYTVLKREN